MKKKKKSLANTISKVDKKASKKKKKKKRKKIYASMGHTLLNMAMSGKWDGGALCGGMYNMPGASKAGKTLLTLTLLACAANDPKFDGYDLVYDDAEERNNFDLDYMFGQAMEERIEPPHGFDDLDEPIHSETIEDFQDGLWDRFKTGKPFIYILDSWDALDCEADIEKYEEQKDARDKGKDSKGSYGMAKAKGASGILRRIKTGLKKTNSLLIIVSQTRADTKGMKAHTRSGGYAIEFWANGEFWLFPAKQQKKIFKTVDGISSQIGVRSRCVFEKNSVKGSNREIPMEAYYDYGIDDISTNIDYLLKHKRWSTKKKTIDADDFDFKGSKAKLIELIEDENLEDELAMIVEETWNDYEEKLRLGRKSRF